MSLPSRRYVDLVRFYRLLDVLARKLNGKRKLETCSGRQHWPLRGVYFFFEDGETRSNSGHGPRLVRVGTHALRLASRTSLWNRLSQHRGTEASGGGNHRGSIFRLLVGTALNEGGIEKVPTTWGKGSSADAETVAAELGHERHVSSVIRRMPFLWLDVPDEPGPDSLRGVIERNAIALLSNYARPALDPASSEWTGHRCDRERVRNSGLWNQNHVDENYDPAFLDVFEALIERIKVAP